MKQQRILLALGQVDDKYIAEAHIAPAANLYTASALRRAALIVACLALLAALTGAAWAANWFGLRDLLLPASPQASANGVIGLSGYQASPEWQALAEWQTFLSQYDTAGQPDPETGGQLDASFQRYHCYRVYAPEMAQQLEAIAQKYGLKLHTTLYDQQAQPHLTALLGSYMQMPGDYTCMYEDGTFQVESTINFAGLGAWDFVLLRSVRGTFHDALLDIGPLSAWQQTPYTTACGVDVTLALSKDRLLVLADLPDSFVTVHIACGADSGLGWDQARALADSIDLAALTPVRMPDTEPVAGEDARRVFAAVLRNLLHSDILPGGSKAEAPANEWSSFALGDVDSDGAEELVLLYETGIMASAQGFVLGYDPEASSVRVQLEAYPYFAFLKNGSVKVLASHNQTTGAQWPYYLYRYLPESDTYTLQGYVHTADRTLAGADYPAAADVSDAGTVYYVGETAWGTEPMDQQDYLIWLEANGGAAEAVELQYLPLSEESILAIEQAP